MKRRFTAFVLALAVCLGLCGTATAASTTVEDKNGNSYTLSEPVLGTNDSFILHEPDPAGRAWERKGTVYVVSMDTEVQIPAGVTGTAVLCIQYDTNKWVTVAYMPLDGGGASITFDGPVYLPDEELNELSYRGTIQQNSKEALLIISSSEDSATRDVGEAGLYFHGDTETYLRNAVLCMVGVAEDSEYAYQPDVSAEPLPAVPTASTVLFNGGKLSFDAYNIGGANYFKLRDLAYVLSGSEKQFSVGWDGAANTITLTSGQPYEAVGGEMVPGTAQAQTATPTASKLLVDGAEVSLTAYNIGGANYFKLRDIGQLFDFGVGWDSVTKTITIDTTTGYTPG